LKKSGELGDYGFYKVVKNTLNMMEEAISSVQDA